MYRMSGTFLVVTLGPFHRAEPAPLVKTLRAQIRLEGPEPQALRANALCQPDQFATDATPGQSRSTAAACRDAAKIDKTRLAS